MGQNTVICNKLLEHFAAPACFSFLNQSCIVDTLNHSDFWILIFSQGAARRLATQKNNIEEVESVGVSGKSDSNRKVKYFRLEVRNFFPSLWKYRIQLLSWITNWGIFRFIF